MRSRQLRVGPRRIPPSPRAGSITGGMLAGLVAWLALPLPALLLFGACVGLAFHLLQTRGRQPWPAGREPVIAGLGLLVPLVITVVLVLAGV